MCVSNKNISELISDVQVRVEWRASFIFEKKLGARKFCVSVHPLSVFIHCQCSSTVSVHPLSVLIHCQCWSTVSVHPLSVLIHCQCWSTVSVDPLSVLIHCQCWSTVSVDPLSVFIHCLVFTECFVKQKEMFSRRWWKFWMLGGRAVWYVFTNDKG